MYTNYISEECQKSEPNKYYKVNDGWFEYYVNSDTGEKKLYLGWDDIEIERVLDPFIELSAIAK